MSDAPNLPVGWESEFIRSYGTVVTAVVGGRKLGSVTVNEDVRNYALGMCPVRSRGTYSGRGWKEALYKDAIRDLRDAIDRHGRHRESGHE